MTDTEIITAARGENWDPAFKATFLAGVNSIRTSLIPTAVTETQMQAEARRLGYIMDSTVFVLGAKYYQEGLTDTPTVGDLMATVRKMRIAMYIIAALAAVALILLLLNKLK